MVLLVYHQILEEQKVYLLLSLILQMRETEAQRGEATQW